MSSLAPVPEDDQLELSDKYDISKGRLWPVNFPEVPRSDYGFPNDSDRCYRNVMVQMLLHLPAFTAWLEDYVMGRHLPKEEVEGSGAWCERINGQPCLLCLFTGLYVTYWTEYQTVRKTNWRDVSEHHYSRYFTRLWNRVWSQWDNGTGNFVGQQDTLEFWPEFLGQLRNDIDPTIADAILNFDRIFYTQTVTVRTCTRGLTGLLKRPCQASPRYINSQTPMLHLQFPSDVHAPVLPAEGMAFSPHPGTGSSYQPSTIEFAFYQYFAKTNMQAACEECECQREECERVREPPECLMLHLNRIDVVAGRARKIRKLIRYNKDLRLDKAFFDPRLAKQGGRRGFRSKREEDELTCYYELFWVGLHNGESHQEGHYHCMAKGRRDWAFLDDLHTGLFDESEFKSQRNESQSYLFGYRRINSGQAQPHPEFVDPVRKVEDGQTDVDTPKRPEGQREPLPDFTEEEWGVERDKVGRLELRFNGSDGSALQSTDVVGVAYNPPAISAGKGLWRVGLPGDKTGTMTLNWYDHTNQLVESCSMEGLLKDLMVARANSRNRSRSRSRSGSKGSKHSEKKVEEEPKPEEPKPDEPKPDEPKPDESKPAEPKPDGASSTRSSLASQFKGLLSSPSKIGKKTETNEERRERRRKKKQEKEVKKKEKKSRRNKGQEE